MVHHMTNVCTVFSFEVTHATYHIYLCTLCIDLFIRYGSLTLTPRVKMSRKMSRQDRPLATETTRPVEVQQSGDGEEATTKDVHNLFKHLKAALDKNPQRRVHYFKFLVHPTSFSQTVENIFHFSFLIKVCRRIVHLMPLVTMCTLFLCCRMDVLQWSW